MDFDYFNLIAPLYDYVFRFLGPGHLLRLLQPQPSQLLLDVGGGTGRVSQTLGSDHQVVICDPSWGMLHQARSKGLTACRGVVERLPFADNTFDRILVVDAFHHFRHQPTAARELLRVLRPAGRLVIEEPDIRLWPVKLVALGERLMLMGSEFYPVHEMAQLFRESGFPSTISQDRNSFNVYLTVVKEPGAEKGGVP
jgi:SAM-dependent methyltransferase